MKPRVLLENKQLEVTLTRLCYQLIEVHNDFSNTVIIGLQPRGIYLAHRIQALLEGILKKKVNCGDLDITFYRDDFRKKELKPNKTNIVTKINPNAIKSSSRNFLLLRILSPNPLFIKLLLISI